MPRKLLLLALLVCGCGTLVTYTSVLPVATVAPCRPEDVDVFLSSPPTDPHIDVGILEAKQESDLSMDDTGQMLKALRREAARHGCDAMFVKGFGSDTRQALLVDAATSVKTITATCIRYTRPERTAAERER
jgi:hypothetical protein